MLNIASYAEDLKYLTIPFGLLGPRQTTVVNTSGLTTPVHNQSRMSNSTVIFAKEIPSNQSGSSTDLKVLFMLTIILTCIEIVIMFHKHHFYSLLAYLSVFAIFFLGYFDFYYLRFVKINLLISVVLDVVWLIFNFDVHVSLSRNIGIQGLKRSIPHYNGDILNLLYSLLLLSCSSKYLSLNSGCFSGYPFQI